MVEIKIDRYSLVPFFVKFKFGDQVLANATAFFYKFGDDLYLISNWHNFSGRNPTSLDPLLKNAGLPDTVSCYLCLGETYVRREWQDFTLSNGDSATWLVHPQHRQAVDVGALPIELPSRFLERPINEMPSTKMRLEVSHDVFILGYPLGLIDNKGFPLWKRASIASEPGSSAPNFLVDTATRSGMSGSPVLQRYRGFYKQDTTKSTPSPDDWWGEGDAFVGVYSGRLGDSEIKAQLGIVWKQRLIQEIIEGKCLYQC